MIRPGAALLVSLTLLPHAPAAQSEAAAWSTALGANSRRDGRVDVVGPRHATPGWSDPGRTDVPLQPVVGTGRVFHARTDDWLDPQAMEIVARDLATGAEEWSVVLPQTDPFGMYSHPVAARDGVVYAKRSGLMLADEVLYALDAATGTTVWASEDLVGSTFTTSPAFLSNGDLIVVGEFLGSFQGYALQRVDHETGETAWRTNDVLYGPERASGVVVEDRLYVPVGLGTVGQWIQRIDVETGAVLYESDPVPLAQGSGSQPMFASADGTLFLPALDAPGSPANELVAYADDGAGFAELWRAPLQWVAWSGFAVQRDGSVVVLDPSGSLVRLHGATGAELARSPVLPWDVTTLRLAIDVRGVVFGAAIQPNAGTSALFAFDRDLVPLWSEEFFQITPVGGVTLAPGGRLVFSWNGAAVDTRVPAVPPSPASR